MTAAPPDATAPRLPPGSSGSLEERYGRGRQRGFDRRFAWIAAGALVLAGLGVLIFGGVLQQSSIEFKDVDYRIPDGRTAALDFQVSTPPGNEAACAIEALSESYATVGWKVVVLPAADRHTRILSETLVTTYPATTATVRSCWVLEPRS